MQTKKLFLLIMGIFILTIANCAGSKSKPHYAVAKLPTPVLNTPHFSAVFGGKDRKTLPLDHKGFIRAVETVALPGTVFTITGSYKDKGTIIYKVETRDYPYPKESGYFVDSRFLRLVTKQTKERKPILPSKTRVIKNLISAVGSEYVWGSNCKKGITQMLKFYPPSSPLNRSIKTKWMLKGVDCSGLLYEATDGYTPRNTHGKLGLIDYGESVEIAGLSSRQIAEKVKPLDLVVWNTHVMIILDKTRIIQSLPTTGVKIYNLDKILGWLLAAKTGVNNYSGSSPDEFVIRRWYH